MIRVVTFGGGGGQAQILSALKEINGLEICACCTSSDSGGSTGNLSENYKDINGYLGDVSKCLCALSPDRELASSMMFRFPEGALEKHSLKNLAYSSLILQHGQRKALEKMHAILKIHPRHRVMPVSWERSILKVELQEGRVLEGEAYINDIARNPLWHPKNNKIVRAWLCPAVNMNSDIKRFIQEADYIIICPGDLYTSLVPSLLPNGVSKTLLNSKAKFIGIMNLMTKLGETDGCKLIDLARIIQRYLSGREFDYLIVNDSSIDSQLLDKYKIREYKVNVLLDDERKLDVLKSKILTGDFWMKDSEGHIRYDSSKIGSALREILI